MPWLCGSKVATVAAVEYRIAQATAITSANSYSSADSVPSTCIASAARTALSRPCVSQRRVCAACCCGSCFPRCPRWRCPR
eukprot:366445-Chlamydomonas_euryale.AAC.3